jgi:DNA-3-methyladenine glycosylase
LAYHLRRDDTHLVTRLPRAFYERDSETVARALLGQRVVRVLDDQRVGGWICETEAYGGADDQASHAHRRTPRSAIMYGPPGYAYVYFIYGMHFCLNAVTEADGQPGAVLIRAIVPDEGVAIMRDRRGRVSQRALTDGPGKLCQALGITRAQNGIDLTANAELFVEAGVGVADDQLEITPRLGVRGDELARGRLWRFVWRR